MAEKKPRVKKKSKQSKKLTRAQQTTAKNKALMLEALKESGCNASKSCDAVGIVQKTHYEWLKKDPDYAEAVEALQEQMIDKVESWVLNKIFDAQRDNDQLKAADMYLKARAKNRGYGVEKRENNLSGKVDSDVEVKGQVSVYLPDNGR